MNNRGKHIEGKTRRCQETAGHNILKNSGLVLVNSSNYNKWQYEQLERYIGNYILEIGCGLGNITQYLLGKAEYLLSVDVKSEAVEYFKKRFAGFNKVHVECLDIFKDGLKKYNEIKFDTIILSNVLEHIEDDLTAMKICNDILSKTHGKLLVIVPAHKFLYGTLDKESGHQRRYSRLDIINLAANSKFRIIDLYAFNSIGALGWYLNYCLLRKKNTNNASSTLQVRFYDKAIVNTLRRWESFVRPQFGLSYIAILEAKQ